MQYREAYVKCKRGKRLTRDENRWYYHLAAPGTFFCMMHREVTVVGVVYGSGRSFSATLALK